MKLKNTKNEIGATMELLASWELFEDLTSTEIEHIKKHLDNIAISAVNEFRNKIGNMADTFIDEH